VTPPFGEEDIILYSSTEELGEIDFIESDAVYAVKAVSRDIGERTRGIKIVGKGKSKAGDFVEENIKVKTK
jgi:hypothetical protein